MLADVATSRSVARSFRALFALGRAGHRDDSELLSKFVAEGNVDAFAELVERHGPMVLRVCRQSLGDQHDADDAFQATFLVLLREAQRIRKQQSVASWLHGVARRVSLKQRSRSLRQRVVETHGSLSTKRRRTATELNADTWDEALHNEIDRLPKNYKAPIVLCYLEGLTHTQAAARLGWPVGTVRGRLARARDRLRDRLGKARHAEFLLFVPSSATHVSESLLRKVCILAAKSAGGSAPTQLSSSLVSLAQGVMPPMLTSRVSLLALPAILAVTFAVGSSSQGHRRPTDAQNTTASAAQVDEVTGSLPATTPVVYHVADLLPSSPNQTSINEQYEPLMALIAGHVAAGTWSGRDVKGVASADDASSSRPGTMTPFLLNNSLIVRQTAEAHEQLVHFLRGLRRLTQDVRPQSTTDPELSRKPEHLPRMPGRAGPSALLLNLSRTYVIKPGDRIRVRVSGGEGLKPVDKESVVTEAGTIDLGPAYGKIAVKGGTPRDAKAAVAVGLRRVMTDVQIGLVALADGAIRAVAPEDALHVTIDVRPRERPSIYVEGAVERPGLYELIEPFRVHIAIYEAGGLKGDPAPQLARLLRANEHGQTYEAIDVNLEDLRVAVQARDYSQAAQLRDGDRLVVFSAERLGPSTTHASSDERFYYVTGAVGNPGRLPWQPATTLIDAINASGQPTGDKNDWNSLRARIVKKSETNEGSRIIAIDEFSKIFEGKTNADIFLDPGDRVHVYRAEPNDSASVTAKQPNSPQQTATALIGASAGLESSQFAATSDAPTAQLSKLKYTIAGAVPKAGSYPISGTRISLVSAIRIAGGFDVQPAPEYARVQQFDSERRRWITFDVVISDLRWANEKGEPEGMIWIRDGDRIHVFPLDQSPVTGPLTGPAPLPVHDSMTIDSPDASLRTQLSEQAKRMQSLEAKLDEVLKSLQQK